MSTDPTAVGEIYNPHALPMYREERMNKRKRMDRMDPVKARIPEFPSNGPAAQDHSMPAARAKFTAAVMETRIKRHNLKDQDSRDELVKYEAKLKGQSKYTGAAYAHNQGKEKELATKTLEEEQEEFDRERKKMLGAI
mmetsp:Transcript_16977/g.49478  ORF Transcript_16977/g.49478 Transcript_16977/m.49478 type:complete len:138 (-) Transcript_16977:9-422(-)